MADFLAYDRAFDRFGIRYEWEPGAKDRGHGDMSGQAYIVEHHTAGGSDAGDIRIVRDGRAGLPGPLSQLVLKRDGSVRIIAVGVCYHAPSNIWFRGVGPGNGNWWSIGIEGVSNGYNDWTPAQRDAYPRVVAALLVDLGLPRDAHKFHRDLQPGEKIDPGGFDNAWFQRMVDAAIDGGTVKTAIAHHRDTQPELGTKVHAEEEIPTLDGIGRFTEYEHGYIYWHPNTGAHHLWKLGTWGKFAETGWEAGPLGYPVADPIKLTGGSAQAFQHGSVYRKDGQPGFILWGAIGDRWAETGWNDGPLGWPMSDEITGAGGIMQSFEHGAIFYKDGIGAREVTNAHVTEEYRRLGGPEGILGFPTGLAVVSQDRRGCIQSFEHGAIYALNGRPTDDGNAVSGVIFTVYGQLGYENGRLGFPVRDVYTLDGRERCDFEGGSIEVDPDGTVYMVMSGKRIEVPLIGEPVTPPAPYRPTSEEQRATPADGMRGGISHFATPGDPSTRGRNMGISGEPADNPRDPWYAAMRFGYTQVQPNPQNPDWVKPVPGTSDLTLKAYLKDRRLKVTATRTGKAVVVRPADWGPGAWARPGGPKYRVIDVSPTAVDALGIDTDDEVTVEWVSPDTPLGPVKGTP